MYPPLPRSIYGTARVDKKKTMKRVTSGGRKEESERFCFLGWEGEKLYVHREAMGPFHDVCGETRQLKAGQGPRGRMAHDRACYGVDVALA